MGPRLKLPLYVHAFVDRHGHARFYFRRRGYKSVPLPAPPWSPAFMAAYEQALGGAPALIGADRHDPRSVDAVVTAYLNSKQFGDELATTTQRMRRALLKRFTAEHGDKRLAMMEPRHVARILDPLRPHPQANMLRAVRGLMAFAIRPHHRCRPNRRLQAQASKGHGRVPAVDRRRCCGVHGEASGRLQGPPCAHAAALHRPAPWRCRADRPPAYSARCPVAQDEQDESADRLAGAVGAAVRARPRAHRHDVSHEPARRPVLAGLLRLLVSPALPRGRP